MTTSISNALHDARHAAVRRRYAKALREFVAAARELAAYGVDETDAPARPGLQVVQLVVAERYRFEASVLWGRGRNGVEAEARQLAMAICRDLLKLPLAEIGRAFCRDHATVIHALRVVADRRENEARFGETYQSLYDACEKELGTA